METMLLGVLFSCAQYIFSCLPTGFIKSSAGCDSQRGREWTLEVGPPLIEHEGYSTRFSEAATSMRL
jgi:hypothetical protein